MILRTWTVEVAEGREEEFLNFASSRSLPMFLAQRGCLGVLFLKDSSGAHTACSFWADQADVDALRNSATYTATARALDETGMLRGAPRVVVFGVKSGGLDC